MNWKARAYEWVVLAALTVCLVIASDLLDVAPSGAAIRAVLVMLVLGMSVLGIYLALSQSEWIAAGISAAMLASIWIYLYVYAVRWGQPFVPTAGGLFFPATLAALFVPAFRVIDVRKTLRTLSWIIMGYALAYLVVVAALGMGLIHVTKEMNLFLAEDPSSMRPPRASLSTTFITLAIALSMARLVGRKHWPSALILVACVAALWFSHSRMITVITVLVCAMYLMVRNLKILSIFGAVSYGAMAVISLVMTFSTVNPWAFMARDLSSRTRMQTIHVVQSTIDAFWLTGTGMPSGGAGYFAVANSKTFYPADVGLVGVMFQFGLIGLIFYSAIAVAGCFAWVPLRRLNAGGDVAQGVTLCAIMGALYSFQAPIYIGASGTFLASLIIAVVIAAAPKVGVFGSRSSAAVRA